jgi:YHS domain-containing protein
MRVDRYASPHTAVVAGRTYHFCSAGCRSKFEQAATP